LSDNNLLLGAAAKEAGDNSQWASKIHHSNVINTPSKTSSSNKENLSSRMPAQEINQNIMVGLSYLAIGMNAVGMDIDWLKPILCDKKPDIIMKQTSVPVNKYDLLVKDLQEAGSAAPLEGKYMLHELFGGNVPNPIEGQALNPKVQKLKKVLDIIKASELTQEDWNKLTKDPKVFIEHVDKWADEVKTRTSRPLTAADILH
jgi:hypothetical protein